MERTRAALVAPRGTSSRRVVSKGSSLEEIAEAAGYTRGAIYKHFANKADSFFAVSDALNTEMLDTFANEWTAEGYAWDDNDRPQQCGSRL